MVRYPSRTRSCRTFCVEAVLHDACICSFKAGLPSRPLEHFFGFHRYFLVTKKYSSDHPQFGNVIKKFLPYLLTKRQCKTPVTIIFAAGSPVGHNCPQRVVGEATLQDFDINDRSFTTSCDPYTSHTQTHYSFTLKRLQRMVFEKNVSTRQNAQ
jgi:hypothetical protein